MACLCGWCKQAAMKVGQFATLLCLSTHVCYLVVIFLGSARLAALTALIGFLVCLSGSSPRSLCLSCSLLIVPPLPAAISLAPGVYQMPPTTCHAHVGTTCGKYLLDHGAFFAMKKREFRPSRFRFLVMKSGGPSNATSSHAGSVESTPRVTSRPEPELPTRDTQAGRAQAAGARLTPPSNALTTSTWSSSSSASVVLEGADTQDGGAVTSGATPGGSPRDTSGSKQVKWEPRNVTAGKSAGGGIDDDWSGSDYTSSKLQELEITLEIIQLERTVS